jgi:hypothetical protein
LDVVGRPAAHLLPWGNDQHAFAAGRAEEKELGKPGGTVKTAAGIIQDDGKKSAMPSRRFFPIRRPRNLVLALPVDDPRPRRIAAG